jgi:hypothetical protein
MADLRFFVTQEGTLNQGGAGNDTIFAFTGTQSATTTKGGGGNDLISFTNQTTAVQIAAHTLSAGAASAGPTETAGTLLAVFSGANVSAGQIKTNATASTAFSAGTVADVSATVQSLQLTGVEVLRSTKIAAGSGNDTIYLGDQITTFNNVSVRGGAGNDILGTFNSGAGVTAKVATVTGGELKGGGGNDTIFFQVSSTSASDLDVVGNAGNDTIQFSGSTELNSSKIAGGAGNDTVVSFTDTATTSTIAGGAGNDSINVINSAGSVGLLINADASGKSGNDTINLLLSRASSNSVYGGEGNDSIVVSGTTDGGKNLYDAGTGNDTVFFNSAGASTISASTVIGGAGNDSIRFVLASAGALNSAIIKGGAGKDTLTFSDVRSGGSAGLVATTIKGGAGADSITVSGVGSGGGSATITYSKYNESVLGGADTLTFVTGTVSADTDATFASSIIKIEVAAGLNSGVSGGGAVSQVSASGGFVVWSGYSDNSLTARVSAVNAGYTTTGDFAVFTTDNTTRYLFVQGGTNDTLIRLANVDALSAGQASLVQSGNTIGLGF